MKQQRSFAKRVKDGCMRVMLAAAVMALAAAAPLPSGEERGSGGVAAASSRSESGALQRLLDEAEAGAVIALPPGEYAGPIVVRKPLELRSAAAGQAILVNKSKESAVRIEADDVTIAGLLIRDGSVKEEPSVLVAAHRAKLQSLHIETGADGIAARDANDGIVRDTMIEWMPANVKAAGKGNGIDLYKSHRWTIQNNVIDDVHDGIYMESSDATIVSGNRIERSRYGIHCMYTRQTVIRDNEGHMNVTGAMVMIVQEVEMTNNLFTKQSENVHSQGILLYDAHQSLFADNTVEGNRVGIYAELSTGNRLERNRIAYNFVGLQLIESENNEIADNLFLSNVSDAQARNSRSNTVAGNYWDSFRGIDTDGDGFSDIGYALNPFFQGLIQKRAAFQLLFQSPGIVLLEKMFESDRAGWTFDHKPRMTGRSGMEHDASSGGRSALTGVAGFALLGLAGWILIVNRRKTG